MSQQPSDGRESERPSSAAEIFGAALGGAARKAGLDPNDARSTPHVVWHAMGGWRGVVESVLPSLAFLLVYTVSTNLPLALGISVGTAVLFTIARFAQRQPPSAALGGLVAVAAAAALALFTGRAQDNFVPGLIINGLYASGLLISALVGWAIIGVAVGFLMGEGTAWRTDRRKRRVFFWLTIAWAGLFAARLAVQLPLYLAGNVAALGTLKLVMGLPLFAPLVALTWLTVRALYRSTPE
ncbi:hypothetical protein FHX49_002573 [Microbacterium endophyticum]|uniref:DUF3159 domain-containing protein n=1 Tax=Microbacterium endophyticum TaxID=1526412 RepID=A0A7W4V505_9MICO|nr:DUF3159 domain-containing protein [Microbacterium endophyticum]MBB2976981.1 hypothetical protein [Microbacterium endophyticum]NIK36733.1 hypothetical protein [Microbacterium endophyticum]